MRDQRKMSKILEGSRDLRARLRDLKRLPDEEITRRLTEQHFSTRGSRAERVERVFRAALIVTGHSEEVPWYSDIDEAQEAAGELLRLTPALAMADDNLSDDENEPEAQGGTQIQWNLQTINATMAETTEDNRLNEQRSASQQTISTEATRNRTVAGGLSVGHPERGGRPDGTVGQETGARSRIQQTDSTRWDL